MKATLLTFALLCVGMSVAIDIRTRGKCPPGICKNGGICTADASGLSFTCTCRTGYEGWRCEYRALNNCKAVNPCGTHGKCVPAENVGPASPLGTSPAHCECTPNSGWYGGRCENNICAGTCLNGGHCTPATSGASFVCTCKPGWEGTRCELRVLDCTKPKQCGHGKCVAPTAVTPTSYCECDKSWNGPRCDRNACHPTNPCKNGAVCVPDESGFSMNCHCKPGWIGVYCTDRPVNCSDRKTCVHGDCKPPEPATPVPRCVCHSGWGGPNCNVPYAGMYP